MSHGFFEMIGTDRCRELLRQFPATEVLDERLERCHGRVLGREVLAPENLPLVDRSSMDGYAVMAQDLFGASESSGAYLELAGAVAVDKAPDFALQPGQCAAITTGGTLPQGADAVLMVEHAEDLGGGYVDGLRSLAPGENVMFAGEDVKKGEPALPAGRVLRVPEIGLLAALGLEQVPVHRRPVVGIISTGDELVPIAQKPAPGQVRDVNSLALACLVQEAGGEAKRLGQVNDSLDALTMALKQALDHCDLVLVSGGSSVGVRDLTIEAIESLPGSEVLAHGVAISPGKPTIIAHAAGRPILGLPGQVASAQVVMLVFGQPLVRHLGGDPDAFSGNRRILRRAELASNLASRQGREDYVRVRLEERNGEPPLAWPRLGKSGLLKTLIEAHGLVRVEPGREGLPRGAEVEVWLL